MGKLSQFMASERLVEDSSFAQTFGSRLDLVFLAQFELLVSLRPYMIINEESLIWWKLVGEELLHQNTETIYDVYVKISSRWWFQIFSMFTPIWGRFPFWRSYFSDGLKPPTGHDSPPLPRISLQLQDEAAEAAVAAAAEAAMLAALAAGPKVRGSPAGEVPGETLVTCRGH